MTQAIAGMALLVADYDDAIAFYVGALGFSLLEDTPLDDGKRWVRVGPPHGTALLLARADGPEQVARIGGSDQAARLQAQGRRRPVVDVADVLRVVDL